MLSDDTKPLSKLLTYFYQRSRGGMNQMWILKNSKDLLEYIQPKSLSSCNSYKTFDFSIPTQLKYVNNLERGFVAARHSNRKFEPPTKQLRVKTNVQIIADITTRNQKRYRSKAFYIKTIKQYFIKS
jgi:hypothetical protein